MSIRTERLAAVIRNDLGEILREYENGAMVSVTQVRLTPDLGLAKVYLSIYPTGRDPEEVFKQIKASVPAIRGALGKRIRHQVRRIPELNFYIDDTAEYVSRMEQIFSKIRKDRGEDPDSQPTPSEE